VCDLMYMIWCVHSSSTAQSVLLGPDSPRSECFFKAKQAVSYEILVGKQPHNDSLHAMHGIPSPNACK
jgi:hypothetical protein